MLYEKELNLLSFFIVYILILWIRSKSTVQNTCQPVTIHVKRFAIQKHLLIFLLLEDIVD